MAPLSAAANTATVDRAPSLDEENISKWPSGGARRHDAPKAATMTRRTATPVRAIETQLSTRGREKSLFEINARRRKSVGA